MGDYSVQKHCNEVMLLPYYIASMNIEHQHYELVNKYLPFTGICLVDTFDLLENQQLSFLDPENAQRGKRAKERPHVRSYWQSSLQYGASQ